MLIHRFLRERQIRGRKQRRQGTIREANGSLSHGLLDRNGYDKMQVYRLCYNGWVNDLANARTYICAHRDVPAWHKGVLPDLRSGYWFIACVLHSDRLLHQILTSRFLFCICPNHFSPQHFIHSQSLSTANILNCFYLPRFTATNWQSDHLFETFSSNLGKSCACGNHQKGGDWPKVRQMRNGYCYRRLWKTFSLLTLCISEPSPIQCLTSSSAIARPFRNLTIV